MSQSSRKFRPSKPRPDFPLFPHATGRWAKKVRGRFVYFGRVDADPQGEAALQLWLDQKDDLLAGRKPRSKITGLTIGDLCNAWLDWNKGRVNSGELSPRTWEGYRNLCETIIDALGRERAAADPGPEDFQRLRAVFSNRWGAGTVSVYVIMTRSLWNWAYTEGKLKLPTQFGATFKKPNAKTMRQERAAGGHGPRMFTADQVKALLKAASPNMKAMLLLGVGAGVGNTDLALTPIDAVDLQGGWLNLPRAKTAIMRRIPLMPESVEAIREVLAHRPQPKPGFEHLLFITQTGVSYLGNRRGTAVWSEYQDAAEAARVTGRTFYDCRRTFATVADNAKDPAAVSAIMGHAPKSGDMQAVYRQLIPDDRLRAVVDVVRSWLFGTEGNGTEDTAEKAPGDAADGQEQAREDNAPSATNAVQRAVCRCLVAISQAEGPDKGVLRSVWNESEIALALSGESSAVERFLRTWGDDADQRPKLRVVG